MSKRDDYRIILIGDGEVGKSSCLKYYAEGTFDSNVPCSWQPNLVSKRVEVERGVKVKLAIWDTCGQERYRSVTRLYYRNSLGVILMYDITSRASFFHLENWIEDVKTVVEEDTVLMLIGNKADKEDDRAVLREEALHFAQLHGMQYRETSCVKGHNISESFLAIAQEIHNIENKKQALSPSRDLNVNLTRDEKSATKCCK